MISFSLEGRQDEQSNRLLGVTTDTLIGKCNAHFSLSRAARIVQT